MRAKPGAVFAVALTLAGLAAVVFAFQNNSSPYVSVKEALASRAERQHLSGALVPGSFHNSVREGLVTFELKDDEGATLPVVYRGNPPANMSAATKIVAVGGVEKGKFRAVEIITKCPSKYESTE